MGVRKLAECDVNLHFMCHERELSRHPTRDVLDLGELGMRRNRVLLGGAVGAAGIGVRETHNGGSDEPKHN
jgi:hypothetical protein